MNEAKMYYEFLLKTDPDFKKFVEEHKHLTTQELAAKYNVNIDIIKEKAV